MHVDLYKIISKKTLFHNHRKKRGTTQLSFFKSNNLMPNLVSWFVGFQFAVVEK